MYYFTKLFYNLILLALYIVQVFTPHQECLSLSGHNITDNFYHAFLLGFIVLAIDFFNSSFLSIYLHLKVK